MAGNSENVLFVSMVQLQNVYFWVSLSEKIAFVVSSAGTFWSTKCSYFRRYFEGERVCKYPPSSHRYFFGILLNCYSASILENLDV